MDKTKNPFADDAGNPTDPDRFYIWNMLVYRDITAFMQSDWDSVADDFLRDEFFGLHGHNQPNPDLWTLEFPDLDSYRTEWLRQTEEVKNTQFAEDVQTAIFNATTLNNIEINADRAIARKKFDGTIAKADGTSDVLFWQTLYYCRKIGNQWKLTGFTGYIPYNMQ